MERITIIGVGPMGASIGRGLMKRGLRDTEVVISSRSRKVLNDVAKLGAADKTIPGLRSAVAGAQLVILDVPIMDIRELLEAIAPILADGAVVTDTSISKIPVLRWADQYITDGASFVGGHPLPRWVPDTLEGADHTIFEGINYTVTPSQSADETAIRTVVGLVESLGAKPLFLDASEHDSYAAAMHYLPIVMSSAFVNATAGSPGWREMHKLAEAGFDDFSRLAANDPMDNEAVCLGNPDALVHWLDQLIVELYAYRNQIKENGQGLLERFVEAWELRARWQAGAVVEDDKVLRLPSSRESMATAFFGDKLASRLRTPATKDPTGDKLKYARRDRPEA